MRTRTKTFLIFCLWSLMFILAAFAALAALVGDPTACWITETCYEHRNG